MNQYTPWNPSPDALARVQDPLPPPECCPNCESSVEIVSNAVIYGRAFGKWPWAYRCTDEDCDSYVGMHPGTNIPLGTLADRSTREARKQAKAAFNPLWQDHGLSRSEAYQMLADGMGIERERCHIGWFTVEQCEQAIEICREWKLAALVTPRNHCRRLV